ncbi:RagB/SusD family nutrient uptake outer membrane protein [Pedobacter sp. MC2016-24]|uniref:RagB/SusD family nutrient uptake outer membrane protein n=1 Tax=Pedobacter sp. MC2016-24 TaxID=2780090 RepID=UPI0018800CDC|nr:RagB/SusD family nutrient uptake outer membrane protein [Pedobacter sp. MC2016-24]MBE9599859.1 RagB/SusD family nutrient uptake outer membrane protein [Pedobacter sp. MC2016-24]
MKNIIIYRILGLFIFLCTLLSVSSCKKFVEVGAPITEIDAAKAFASDASANSAILGIYTKSVSGANGIVKFYTVCMGNSSDELQSTTGAYTPFMNNSIPVNSNTTSQYLWAGSYAVIAQCNFAIEGLNGSQSLTPAVKSNLMGEVKFWRAFIYFYLVNMFGDVPMPLGTNSVENGKLPRVPSTEVWSQIVKDLKDAQTLLNANYPATGIRSRINKSVADAFLSRVYLYQKDWLNAESEATKVIQNSENAYSIVDKSAIADVFKNTSKEIIWQISNADGISTFGPLYNYLPGVASAISIPETYYLSFETNDFRLVNWVKVKNTNGSKSYEVYKYKGRSGTGGNEYDVVMRLAEQYLIRAEARARLQKLTGDNSAASDLDKIRLRANLNGTTATTMPQMLFAIEQERKHELFGEFGHRWLDLKRTPSLVSPANKSRADDILGPIKLGWISDAQLYPIPASQILANPSLIQNPGYMP